MTTPINNSRAGTCPHGCPQGACPICNGMASGMQTRKIETTKPREMSWSECYAQWQKILAKQAEKHPKHDIFAAKNNTIQGNNKFLSALTGKIFQIGNYIFNKMPTPVKNIVNGINKILIKPTKQIFNSISSKMSALGQKIKDTLINITDKLAAIFGEEKMFKDKNLSDSIKNLPKKLFKLFGLYDVEDEQEEEQVIEEEKRLLEIKDVKETLLHIDGKEGSEDDKN